ncbi:tetratricopeptide repeat protein [Hydrogenophaga sp. BPS33]|uniref:tetratricopeptide repeat protein n=1 Tax=Hydrogenophaga sp. BPS33 TaxID=2651974 RepID=UPI0013202A1D|nr:tetratricopeptide repeat protein [Hydrogenophaga sp. BPS33]QHE86808.1 tetratricopeptide repeat protein [Hydrogenophaga sp. BPS33]
MSASRLAPAQQMQLAVHFHSHGQLDEARALYESLLQQFPAEFAVLHHLGMLETQAQRTDQAAGHFARATQIDPQNADAWNNLAYTLQQLERDAEALQAYGRALALKPGDADVAVNLGLLHKRLQQLPQAIEVFDAALEFHPRHVALLTNRGNVLQQLGRSAEALDSYQQALAAAPDNPVVLSNLANVLRELARYDEALRHADHATQAHPRHAPAWVERGGALKMLDRTADAVGSYEKALALAPELLSAHTGLAATVLSDEVAQTPRVIGAGQASLTAYLRATYQAPALKQAGLALGLSRFKHDVQQAQWLREHGHEVPGLDAFLDTGPALLQTALEQGAAGALRVSGAELARMQPFLSAPWLLPMPASLPHVLHPDNDWRALEDRYLAGTPEILTIDRFLSEPALQAFQAFAHASRVWHGEYARNYLGAFANRGFSSPLHLQLARELRQRMPRVFKDYRLTQLWGFKYEPSTTKGINVHADFAKVNLNFWIAPDAHNLDPDSGGLKVYDVPAPAEWSFEQYNADSVLIYDFLQRHGARCVTVPHRCNRAVLFNSALLHETDTVRFVDRYEGRRVNMTYLFGQQLR